MSIVLYILKETVLDAQFDSLEFKMETILQVEEIQFSPTEYIQTFRVIKFCWDTYPRCNKDFTKTLNVSESAELVVNPFGHINPSTSSIISYMFLVQFRPIKI